MKASLDPESRYLPSWTINGDPCDGSFEGVACNEKGQVANVSLQGKGLLGKLSPAIAGLNHLTGLYLHYNSLYGEIPREIANLTYLVDLYLNVNNLTGEIPREIASMENLQVLQLCYNQLTGSIPIQLGALKNLRVVALQSNHLTGAIPASLGDLGVLVRLDLSSNNLFGSIPTSLADAPSLKVLDVHNNTLSGNVPPVGFSSLKACNASDHVNSSRPEPYGAATRDIPETANVKLPCNGTQCLNSSKSNQSTTSITVGIFVVIIALSAIGILTFTLEYSSGWDPLADTTQYFSELNLLGKNCYSATYKGVLRDGSVVAVKSISKTSCKSDEAEFMKGLNMLTSLRNDNVVRLRGFCCSRGRGECFLIYDFVANGNLSRFLDAKGGDGEVLEWSTRVSIVKGIAKGMAYLHAYKANKPVLVHQNISADKILIDQRYNPLLADSGLYKLLTNDIVFSALKGSAAKGYLAPEYATTGRFAETSDVYAFGVVLFQILSGKHEITSSIRLAAESSKFQEFIDPNLNGRFFEYEAAKLAKIALLCSHESPFERPSMETIVQELVNCSSCL
uniref:LRR receptor-like serine/threonine-protein kinase At4g08850 family n=1 Tax=Cajanus cajan TaxID=3821 RepID=A0A151U5P6_CAJCA|nr:putative LRR receptor-like serine/threonine-protein kinase At4g08850 family [Cajanus cajan]